MVSGRARVVVDEVARQGAIDQHREFARGGGNRFGLAGADSQTPIESAERAGGAREAHRAAAQGCCGSISGWRSSGAEQASAGNFVVGGQRKPGGKMLFDRPAAHVETDLGNDLQRGVRADAVDLA